MVLLVALYYSLSYSSLSTDIERLTQEIETSRSEREKKKKGTADLAKFKEEMRQLDGRLKQAIAQLPDRREIPDLLTSISNKGREAGLEVVLFRPRSENVQEFYAEVPMDIMVRGGFHNVVAFFDEVGRLNRLVNINNIELKNPKPSGDQVIMEATALATAFRFVDDAERAKLAAEKAKKK
jgi:type IV pilus assembly protein PilO